jgi:hypothetical protein
VPDRLRGLDRWANGSLLLVILMILAVVGVVVPAAFPSHSPKAARKDLHPARQSGTAPAADATSQLGGGGPVVTDPKSIPTTTTPPTTTTIPATTTTAAPPASPPRPAPPAPPTTSPPASETAAANSDGYGCADALAYLQAHAAPGFVFECPGYAEGHQAMTCVNVAGVCPGARVIAISVPCSAAYMNEASNSWVVLGESDAPIDPYGYCQ